MLTTLQQLFWCRKVTTASNFYLLAVIPSRAPNPNSGVRLLYQTRHTPVIGEIFVVLDLDLDLDLHSFS